MKGVGTWIVLVALGVIFIYACSTYDGLVTVDEEVNKSWSEVQNQYARRADLTLNLVRTVQGYAKHEQSVLTAVTEARARVGQMNVDASKLANSVEMQKQFIEAQQGLSSALSRLLVVTEAYPTLKADQGFRDLQAQLEGTENRITIARNRAINATQAYNETRRKSKNKPIASIFGFGPREYYQATDTQQTVPTVSFQ